MLRLRSEGLTVAAIAERLGISDRTVHYRLAAASRRDELRRLVAARLEGEGQRRPRNRRRRVLPRPPLSRTYLVGRVHFVQNADQAHEMIQAAYENPVS